MKQGPGGKAVPVSTTVPDPLGLFQHVSKSMARAREAYKEYGNLTGKANLKGHYVLSPREFGSGYTAPLPDVPSRLEKTPRSGRRNITEKGRGRSPKVFKTSENRKE